MSARGRSSWSSCSRFLTRGNGGGSIVQVDLWELVKDVVIPALAAVVGFLWRRIDKVRDESEQRSAANAAEISALRLQIAAQALDNERRYVNSKHLDDIRNELVRRFDRIEGRLDNALASRAGLGEAGSD
jgi:hypothetical protein